MALPLLLQPAGTPPFLVAGHALTPQALHDDVARMIGHQLKRKISTSAPQIRAVSTILEASEAAAWDDWLENPADVANEFFTADFLNAQIGDGRYFAAQWVDPPQWQAMQMGRWALTGQLLIVGPGSDALPDDGSIELNYDVALTGSGRLVSSVAFGCDYTIALTGSTPFECDYEIALLAVVPSYELREDGGLELREDGGREQRE
jgi:hypothetical protein